MIERLRELRGELKSATALLVKIQSEIDEIEFGVIEKPVLWYEQEWLVEKNGSRRALATAYNPEMTKWIMGSQKLVKACKSKAGPNTYKTDIQIALKEMGVEE